MKQASSQIEFRKIVNKARKTQARRRINIREVSFAECLVGWIRGVVSSIHELIIKLQFAGVKSFFLYLKACGN